MPRVRHDSSAIARVLRVSLLNNGRFSLLMTNPILSCETDKPLRWRGNGRPSEGRSSRQSVRNGRRQSCDSVFVSSDQHRRLYSNISEGFELHEGRSEYLSASYEGICLPMLLSVRINLRPKRSSSPSSPHEIKRTLTAPRHRISSPYSPHIQRLNVASTTDRVLRPKRQAHDRYPAP